MRLSVTGFILKSLTQLELSIAHGDGYASIFILLHVDIQVCLHRLLNMFSLFILCVCFFVKNQVFVGMWNNIWIFDLVPLVLLSVLMPIPGCFQYCSSIVEFENRNHDASRSSFIVQNCFGYPGFCFVLFCFSLWSWILFFWGMQRILLGFCWALHWICILLLIGRPF